MLPEIIMKLFKFVVLGIGRVSDIAVRESDRDPGFEYSDVNVTTGDKVVLRAYLVKPLEINRDTRFFIVCHGTGCNQYSYSPICSRSGPLAGKNVCVLFADYREFGSSEGQFSMDGASHDIDAYLRYMRETLRAEKVHLWGHALGAAVILKYVCDVQSEKREILYDRIFLVSTFMRFGNAVCEAIRSWVFEEHLARALYYFVFSGTLERYFSYDNMKAIECVDAKEVLIVHSDADEISPMEEAEELSRKSGAKLVITKGDHNHTIGDPEVWRHVFEFVSCSDMTVPENPLVSTLSVPDDLPACTQHVPENPLVSTLSVPEDLPACTQHVLENPLVSTLSVPEDLPACTQHVLENPPVSAQMGLAGKTVVAFDE